MLGVSRSHATGPLTDLRGFARVLCLCGCLGQVLGGCSAEAASRADAGALTADAVTTDGGLTAAAAQNPGAELMGAGMPLVPIRRVDAGTSAPVMTAPADAGAPRSVDAAAPAAQDVVDAQVDASALEEQDAQSAPLEPSRLTHHYDFSGNGMRVSDRLGSGDITLLGSAHLDSGAAVFGQSSEDVGWLPADVLSGLRSFTLLVWLVPASEECGQRVLGFRERLQVAPGSGEPGGAALYLYSTSCPDRLPSIRYSLGASIYHLYGANEAPVSEPVQLGFAYDAASQQLQLIVDGEVQKQVQVPIDLDALARGDGRIGLSASPNNTSFRGSVTELRIYSPMLDAPAVAEVFERGPDQL